MKSKTPGWTKVAREVLTVIAIMAKIIVKHFPAAL
jgi:hypothetical protein